MAKPRGKRGRRKGAQASHDVKDYRHEEAKRKNNPEVGLPPDFLKAWERKQPRKQSYNYDPYKDPQLVWAGKAGLKAYECEKATSFEVDTVSLHIHERVSTQAIIKAVRKNGDPKARQMSLDIFADPQLPFSEAVEFYQHDVDWANRLILGDSLLVMNSLLQRELMAGKVQMIYVDPPYGVAYNSNFQPSTRQRDVKDGQDDSLTREPEQIKAYRDTWTLGIHSYLTYLRDRLLLCKELLAETGSIFVQISDENLHHVRQLMDETFGCENFCGIIPFSKTGGLSGLLLDSVLDYILWYAKSKQSVKYRQLYMEREAGGAGATGYTLIDAPDGRSFRSMTKEEMANPALIPQGWRIFDGTPIISQGYSEKTWFEFEYGGTTYTPPRNRHWSTTREGLERLAKAGRLVQIGNRLEFKRYFDDFSVTKLTNIWLGTGERGFTGEKLYVVQTATKVIERCMLMTTDPGDLVFDPTCGSGTTAYVAEQWGRRWITCDTSRVALALARQRLLTATFPYYQLKHPEQGVDAGFEYEKVPHIMLKFIAQNPDLDPAQVEGKSREEIEAIIRSRAEQETLYDKPLVDKRKVRVSGPFTVESIPVPSIEDSTESPITQWESLEPGARDDDLARRGRGEADEGTNFILNLIEALKKDGLTRVGGGLLKFARLNAIPSAGVLHAEGELDLGNGKRASFAVSFGPRYGPITIAQVEQALQQARGRYDGVALIGFTFDGPAQEFLKRDLPLQVLGAYLAPDVLVGDLLKSTKGSQLFTLFGQADIAMEKVEKGFMVRVDGVDLYNPQTGEVESAGASEIAAWFLDTDYDQRTFNICQAFFPGGTNPWEKLQRALKGIIAPEAFEGLRGLESLSFEPGPENRVAVKVIDHRGNEMLEVFDLNKLGPQKKKQARQVGK